MKLIAVEGIDCSGKTTLVTALMAALPDRGIYASAHQEPSGGPIGRLFRQFSAHDGHDPRALALLSALLSLRPVGMALALVTAALLGAGSINPLVRSLGLGTVDLGFYHINYLALAGNITALSRAITLVESTNPAHLAKANEVINACLAHANNSVRIAITGAVAGPGAGGRAELQRIHHRADTEHPGRGGLPGGGKGMRPTRGIVR